MIILLCFVFCICFFYIVAEKPLGGSFNKCMYVCILNCVTLKTSNSKEIMKSQVMRMTPRG